MKKKEKTQNNTKRRIKKKYVFLAILSAAAIIIFLGSYIHYRKTYLANAFDYNDYSAYGRDYDLGVVCIKGRNLYCFKDFNQKLAQNISESKKIPNPIYYVGASLEYISYGYSETFGFNGYKLDKKENCPSYASSAGAACGAAATTTTSSSNSSFSLSNCFEALTTNNSSSSYVGSVATCGAASSSANSGSGYSSYISGYNTEKYDYVPENYFRYVLSSPVSTFSADVDTASYSNLRARLTADTPTTTIPEGMVRIEEMINYFDYDYPTPEEGTPFAVKADISQCPWNPDNDLLIVGCTTKEIEYSEDNPSNYVFLVDVSGSMYKKNKIGLLIKGLDTMIHELKRNDTISIVTYSGSASVMLDGMKGSDKLFISSKLNSIETDGCTNGEAGINMAYDMAEKYFIEGGNNRVILATDGDFNVGASSDSELVKLIKEKSQSGIGLSVLGFGTGNLNDSMMEKLADNGNGVYFYIDSEKEAKKVLCDELSANTTIVAKDVKFQIEFNPQYVSEYRQIGYENRALNTEDFENDSVDAGEMGSGRSITVIYEIKHPDTEGILTDDLKYQDFTLSDYAYTDEWMTLSLRYKEPYESKSKLIIWPLGESLYTDKPDDDYIFASLVADYGMLLREQNYNYDDFESVSKKLHKLHLKDDYKKEFEELVDITVEKSKDGTLCLN